MSHALFCMSLASVLAPRINTVRDTIVVYEWLEKLLSAAFFSLHILFILILVSDVPKKKKSRKMIQ